MWAIICPSGEEQAESRGKMFGASPDYRSIFNSGTCRGKGGIFVYTEQKETREWRERVKRKYEEME